MVPKGNKVQMQSRLRALELELWADRAELRIRGGGLQEPARDELRTEVNRLELEVERLRTSLSAASGG